MFRPDFYPKGRRRTAAAIAIIVVLAVYVFFGTVGRMRFHPMSAIGCRLTENTACHRVSQDREAQESKKHL